MRPADAGMQKRVKATGWDRVKFIFRRFWLLRIAVRMRG